MSVQRIISTETEYGIYQVGNPWANPIALSSRVVDTYAKRSREGTPAHGAAPVGWDYTAEDPLNDLRGTRMSRAAADPSLLTDDPYHLAPSGGCEEISRPKAEELLLPTVATTVLTNGARLYVDHAHPEYSSPETLGPRDAVLWDRAGDVIARRVMADLAGSNEGDIVLVKNNTDGKGASYGAHENYQVRRDTDLDDLIRCLTPFFVTRPVLCASGRVGIGQKSQKPGFQISQRADFVENEVGLETTFNRPIINTRDEPHADPAHFRRLHVIGGDANLFDISTYLRLGTTSLVLWAIEMGVGLEWEALRLDDPVGETWNVSHDPTLRHTLVTAAGKHMSALDIQQAVIDLVLSTFDRTGIEIDPDSRDLLDLWQSVVDRMRTDLFSVATEVEWVAKYQLLSRQKDRLGTEWSDPRLSAMDIQWANLREDRSLVTALDRAGRVRRLFTTQQVEYAADHAPTNTRAHLRGHAVAHRRNLVKASWTSLVFDPGHGSLLRIPLPDAADPQKTIDIPTEG